MVINTLPESLSGVTRMPNLQFKSCLDRTNNSFLEQISISKENPTIDSLFEGESIYLVK